MKERNYGIDLLRLISMFMIVMLHVLGSGLLLTKLEIMKFETELLWSIEIVCYCSVNCFALISGYVGIRSKHKYSSIISLCMQVVFYCIACVLVGLLLSKVGVIEGMSTRFIINSLFAPTAGHYWYFNAYFCLFFLMPLLNHVINTLHRNTMKKLIVAIFLIFSCCTLLFNSVTGVGKGYSVLWLAILYLFGGYISKYDSLKKWSTKASWLIFIVCILLTIASRISLAFVTTKIFGEPKQVNMFVAYSSPTILLASVFLLNICSRMRVGERGKKVIGLFAPTAFGIYILHCHPVIYDLVLSGAFMPWLQYNTFALVGLLLLAAIGIFTACALIDLVRIRLFRLCKIDVFCVWLADKIGKLLSKILKWIGIDLREEVEVVDKKDETPTIAEENNTQA